MVVKTIKLFAFQIADEYSIVDFAQDAIRYLDDEKQIKRILKNIEMEYHKYIIQKAEEKFSNYLEEKERLFAKYEKEFEFEDLIDVGELEKIEESNEIEPLEMKDGEDELKWVIKNDIYMKNIKIEQTIGRYPESETENYWMIGININNVSEQELQEMSIFDRDFW